MRILGGLIAGGAIIATMLSSAARAETTVFITNKTDAQIVDVVVSIAGVNDWFDVDQGTVLEPGYKFSLTFAEEDGCRFDFRATYADRYDETIPDVEVCEASRRGDVWIEFDMGEDLTPTN